MSETHEGPAGQADRIDFIYLVSGEPKTFVLKGASVPCAAIDFISTLRERERMWPVTVVIAVEAPGAKPDNPVELMLKLESVPSKRFITGVLCAFADAAKLPDPMTAFAKLSPPLAPSIHTSRPPADMPELRAQFAAYVSRSEIRPRRIYRKIPTAAG